MSLRFRFLCAGLAWACALLLAGCAALSSSGSVSNSSDSVSNLSGSIQESSASSSSSLGGHESAALERDIETATVVASEGGGDADAVLRGVSDLCQRYALTDWEAEPAVRSGIARGLAASGVPPRAVERFERRVTGPEPAVRDALQDALAARP